MHPDNKADSGPESPEKEQAPGEEEQRRKMTEAQEDAAEEREKAGGYQ